MLWLKVSDTTRIKDGLKFCVKYNTKTKKMVLKSWNGMGGCAKSLL